MSFHCRIVERGGCTDGLGREVITDAGKEAGALTPVAWLDHISHIFFTCPHADLRTQANLTEIKGYFVIVGS